MPVKTSPLAVALGAAAIMLWAGSASAVTIFFDNFDGPARLSVGNGWSETERDAKDVRIVVTSGDNGRLQLRDDQGDPDAAAVNGDFSTVGFTNIQVSFDWARINKKTEGPANPPADKLFFSWSVNGTATWTINPTDGFTTDNNGFQNAVINLGALAAGTHINVMFFTDITENAHAEGFRVDNFVLSGDSAAPGGSVVTPLPGALPLLASGIAFFGGILYRRRRKADRAAA